MGRSKLWLVLLLAVTFYIPIKAAQVNLVKTIGSETDVTPICTNVTWNIIMLIVCKIRTERTGGDECSLVYKYQKDFELGCDSRFTLVRENQTVFLHLTSLRPEDSGNYTCECSHADGTNILSMNITVEEDEDTSSSTEMPYGVIGVFIIIIILGVIVGIIYIKITNSRRQLEPVASRPNTEPQNIEPYLTFIQRENELYSSAELCHYTSTNDSNMFIREDTNLRIPL